MVLFIEDENSIMDVVYNLIQAGYPLKWVNNMYDAVYYIQKHPGYEEFSAVILDMNIQEDGLPDEAIATARDVYPGWAFYKHILGLSPRLQQKTIILSGFVDELREKISQEEYYRLTIIRKNNVNHLEIIENTLKEWGIQPKTTD